MIDLKNEEEEFIFKNNWDVAIPLSYDVTAAGTMIDVFPSFEHVAKKMSDTFGADMFSERCFEFLRSTVAPVMSARGYVEEKHEAGAWGYILRYGGMPHTSETCDAEIRRCTAEDENINITGYDIDATVSDGRLCYGAVCDRKVVAVALTHSPVTDTHDGCVEIGVECALKYRRRGFASACAAALAHELKSRGLDAEYRCRHTNLKSLATAHRAGFREFGRYYYYVFVRREK